MAAPQPVPTGRHRDSSQRICPDCGEPFEVRGGGSEELCEYCHEAAYQPSRVRLGERLNGRRHHAR